MFPYVVLCQPERDEVTLYDATPHEVTHCDATLHEVTQHQPGQDEVTHSDQSTISVQEDVTTPK